MPPHNYSSDSFERGNFHVVQICPNGGVYHIANSIAQSPLDALHNVHKEYDLTKFHRHGSIYLINIPDKNPNGFPCLFEFDPDTKEITSTIL